MVGDDLVSLGLGLGLFRVIDSQFTFTDLFPLGCILVSKILAHSTT
jgi:hypothetical protein